MSGCCLQSQRPTRLRLQQRRRAQPAPALASASVPGQPQRRRAARHAAVSACARAQHMSMRDGRLRAWCARFSTGARTSSCAAVFGHSGRARVAQMRHSCTASAAFSRWCAPASPSCSGTPRGTAKASSGGAVSSDTCGIACRTPSARPAALQARGGRRVRPGAAVRACSFCARCSSTTRASSGCVVVTAGTPALRMPAFSPAMSVSVCPRMSMWSYPSDVMPHTAGAGTTLVASHRPPRPTSRTATSTRSA